jgi:hypothetical protein
MRKINIFYLLFGFILFLSSCVRTEADLFDESAALRINHAVSDSKELLLSATNGWVMEYFPTNAQAGVTFLLKFDKNGMATIATKNEYITTYAENTGEWEVIPESGPVLTFNTYIDIFHLFSDPSSGLGKGLGLGLEGDYEFIIMNSTNDFIQLKGKKRGTEIILHRLEENQNWSNYFTILENMNASLFNTNFPVKLNLLVKDKAYTLQNGSSHIFTASPIGIAIDDETESDFEIPFIITSEGIRFAQAVEIDDQSVRIFKLSEDKNTLTCTDKAANAMIVGPKSEDVLFDLLSIGKSLILTNNASNMSTDVQAIYDKIAQSTSEKNRTLTQISFTKDKTWGNSLFIRIIDPNKKNLDCYFSYNFTKESDRLLLSFNGFDETIQPNNGKVFYDQFAGTDDLLKLIEGRFSVAIVDNAFRPSSIKLTSISNPNSWFIITAK